MRMEKEKKSFSGSGKRCVFFLFHSLGVECIHSIREPFAWRKNTHHSPKMRIRFSLVDERLFPFARILGETQFLVCLCDFPRHLIHQSGMKNHCKIYQRILSIPLSSLQIREEKDKLFAVWIRSISSHLCPFIWMIRVRMRRKKLEDGMNCSTVRETGKTAMKEMVQLL